MKYLDGEYWVVERNGVYWTDYLYSKKQCKDEIKECARLNSDSINNYIFRLMTDKDIEERYPEVVEGFEPNEKIFLYGGYDEEDYTL